MGNARINRVPFYLTKNLQFFIVFEGKIFILINYRRYKKKLYNYKKDKRRKSKEKRLPNGGEGGTMEKRRKGRLSAEEKIYFLSNRI